MTEYVKIDDVWNMLNDIGGCGAEPESWADGWDKAINTAVEELENIPTAYDVSPNKIDLKPCPFCGTKNVYSEYHIRTVGGPKRHEIEIGCIECKYHLTTGYQPKGNYLSLEEITKFTEMAAKKWNTRTNKF